MGIIVIALLVALAVAKVANRSSGTHLIPLPGRSEDEVRHFDPRDLRLFARAKLTPKAIPSAQWEMRRSEGGAWEIRETAVDEPQPLLFPTHRFRPAANSKRAPKKKKAPAVAPGTPYRTAELSEWTACGSADQEAFEAAFQRYANG